MWWFCLRGVVFHCWEGDKGGVGCGCVGSDDEQQETRCLCGFFFFSRSVIRRVGVWPETGSHDGSHSAKRKEVRHFLLFLSAKVFQLVCIHRGCICVAI